ncbi:DUF5643 domain-containing protein [Paenibacillus agri]|uniref:DUF4179 domain-containing protein n=1 Tax=Paenibacillus agri TaxID=2744309 RepID=A0A850EVX5_9BACL|nr:DUF5643 domain-containing protein [Paenibacillus agri]NUU63012.1 DUF4179 domain-containing protein [Paenibacillus agri]
MNNNNLEKQLRELGRANTPELPPLLRSRQDSIYATLGTIVQDPPEKKKKRKVYPKIAAVAAAILISVMLTAIYPPALANALKQLPWVGGIFERADDLGLQAAQRLGLISRPNSSDTHDGITLSAEEAVFDGSRLAFSVKREAEELDGNLTGVTVGSDGKPFLEKGTITSATVLINGATLEEYSDGLWEAMPLLTWLGGKEDNTAIFRLVDSSNLGLSAKPFPDQFVLTVTIGLEGIDEPFILQIPAQKVTTNTISTPDISAQAVGWTMLLQKLEYSPLTTRLSLMFEQGADGDPSALNGISFEVKDEQGVVLNFISQKTLPSSNGSFHVDLLTEPFDKHPNRLTIRAYLNEFKDPKSKTGAFRTDSSGNPVKHYIDGLEISVLVQ